MLIERSGGKHADRGGSFLLPGCTADQAAIAAADSIRKLAAGSAADRQPRPFFFAAAVYASGERTLYLQLGKKRTIPIYLRFKHRKKTLIRIFPPLRRLRSDWLRHTRFCLLASVGLPDAAQTALLCASLQAALCRVSRLDARVQPQYRAPGYDVHFECIAAFRLGKLWLTAAALAFAAARRSIQGGTAGGNHPGSADQHGHADRA